MSCFLFYFTIDSTPCFNNRVYKVWHYLVPFMDEDTLPLERGTIAPVPAPQILHFTRSLIVRNECYTSIALLSTDVMQFMLLIKGWIWDHSDLDFIILKSILWLLVTLFFKRRLVLLWDIDCTFIISSEENQYTDHGAAIFNHCIVNALRVCFSSLGQKHAYFYIYFLIGNMHSSV